MDNGRRYALGLTYGQVRLAQSDPRWPGRSSSWRPSCARPLGSWRSRSSMSAPPPCPAWSPSDPGHRDRPGARCDPHRAVAALQPLGYRFRGDKGGDGGLLLVLEDRPAHRVAHLHLVRHGDPQWCRYVTLRDRLRADPAARAAYAGLKGGLATRFAADRAAYTAAKAAFIAQLLSRDEPTAPPRRRPDDP